MSHPVIQIENLSKAYQIGQIGSRTLSRDLDRLWQMKVLRREDPFLKIGETNDRSTIGGSDIVWSLKNINFEINQGDAVGIIGKNGAGKSTLLKLLSRVTSPTTGQINVKGRIASLLEVGTGFHPELSGKENIYLNGAILGMRKKEITRKLDEIIDFSGVARYIDTPVKRYSSGMYVRLAFAVAAHLESEILIVDEVLAVGDAEFQKKCLGKMGDISKGEGRTVLFVSHNMGAISKFCNRGLYLSNGEIALQGSIQQTIDAYINSNAGQTLFRQDGKKENSLLEAQTSSRDFETNHFGIEQEITVNIRGKCNNIMEAKVGIALLDKNKNKVFTSHHLLGKSSPGAHEFALRCTIPAKTICPGDYSFDMALFNSHGLVYDYINDICGITVLETGSDMYADSNFGSVFINCDWHETTK